mgnify:CR=1 FL=1
MIKAALDFHEVTVFIEACFHAGTILRASILDKIADNWYHMMNQYERKSIYSWLKRRYGDDELDERQRRFMARFNPENQYLLTMKHEGEEQKAEAYEFEGKYWVGNQSYADEKYITNKERIDCE